LAAPAGAVEITGDLGLPHQLLDFRARRRPFGEPGADNDRLDDQHDLVSVSVMRTQLATLVRIEPALEQGAENASVVSLK